jgi:hypothetical protein
MALNIPAFAAESFPDSPQLTRMQGPTRAVVSTLRGCPLVNGAMVSHTFTGVAAAQSFAHKLGRTPVGWLVVDVDTPAATFHRTAWNDQTITIDPSVNCTVTFWVF